MKKILTILVVFLFPIQFVSAQKIDTSKIPPSRASYDFYMQRHSTYKTVGWLMLAPGVTMIIIGTAESGANTLGDNLVNAFKGTSANYDSHKGETVAYIGSGLVLAGITSFIIAGHSKRKASLALKNGSIANAGMGGSNLNYTAVCLKIQF